MAIGTRMLQRRASAAVWSTAPYVLAEGELGVTTDTGIIKIGDGVNTWANLDPAFDSQYLPLLGKAADSELLDGVSVDSLLKLVDVTTTATNDKVARRLANGRLKATTATEADDLTTLAQVEASQRELISRVVTGSPTIALSDLHKILFVNHSSLTTQLIATIPANVAVDIPVGSWVDVAANGSGGVKITPAVGVTITGITNVFPNYGVVRILKTGVDSWTGIALSNQQQSRLPKIRVYRNVGAAYTSGVYSFIPYNLVDSATDFYNPDNEWFSIPGTGLSTSRRVIVNKAGEYLVVANFNAAAAVQSFLRLYMMVADNSGAGGRVLASAPTYIVGNITTRVRLSAGQSIGAAYHAATGESDQADGTSGDRNDLTITRIGD